MDILLMLILVVIVLAAAGYTHYRLPFHTNSPGGLWFIRIFLIVLGIAFGLVSAGYYAEPMDLSWVLGFLGGFGLVHVPGAVILFLKRQRARDLGQGSKP